MGNPRPAPRPLRGGNPASIGSIISPGPRPPAGLTRSPLRCPRCHHRWVPRVPWPRLPFSCPGCRDPNWKRPYAYRTYRGMEHAPVGVTPRDDGGDGKEKGGRD